MNFKKYVKCVNCGMSNLVPKKIKRYPYERICKHCGAPIMLFDPNGDAPDSKSIMEFKQDMKRRDKND